MSERNDNIRRGRDLEDWNQRRFEQEVAEEIGISREKEDQSGTRRTDVPGETRKAGSTETEHKFGTESERSKTTGKGSQEFPRC
jgi:hypothetical protein